MLEIDNKLSRLISIGNETLDKFLGGGILNGSLNFYVRQGPTSRILDAIINNSFAASTLASKNALIYINFNTASEINETNLLASLPSQRKIKSELLYKDVRGIPTTQIKIAWRYSNRSISRPSDNNTKINQIDFGVPLIKSVESEDLGKAIIVNTSRGDTMQDILKQIQSAIEVTCSSYSTINILLKDLIHPFSSLLHNNMTLLEFSYGLRCLTRTLKQGAILVCFDSDMCDGFDEIKLQLYNLADSVIVFSSYETDQNLITGYRDIDGTLKYIKVPKINSYGFHFQQDLSDWGYRLTHNHRFFVVDELSLPPSEDDNQQRKGRQSASDLTKTAPGTRPLVQVGPLEEFREVAHDVIAKKLI